MSSLINAPAYDPRRDNLIRNSIIGFLIFIGLTIVIGMGGFIAGHGWFFSNIPAERKVSHFLDALEARDYNKAYDIYTNGHADSGYSIKRFTEDWTTYSPVKGLINSHHMEISKTDGTGVFGTGIIVAAHINSVPTCAFIYVNRSDGTLSYPAPHEIGYDKCNNL